MTVTADPVLGVAPERPRARSGRRRRDAIRATHVVYVVALILLVALDIFSAPGVKRPATFLIFDYAVKTGFVLAIIAFGLRRLSAAPFPRPWKTAITIFLLIVLAWFLWWLATGDVADLVTILLNPAYSAPAWMFVLLIPLAATDNIRGNTIRALRAVPPAAAAVLCVVLALLTIRFELLLNLETIAVATVLLVCIQPDDPRIVTRVWRAGLCLAVALSMLIAGYRTYFVALTLLGLTYIGVRRMSRRLTIVAALGFLMAPILFNIVVSQWGNTLSAMHSSLFTDTRTMLFTELFDDLSFKEVIAGRGLAGTYYSPYFAMLQRIGNIYAADHPTRFSVEVSWLNMILKFGLLGLLPYFVTIITPILIARDEPASPLPIDGLRRFSLHILLISMAELPNEVNASYFAFFFALGTLMASRLRLLPGRARLIARWGA